MRKFAPGSLANGQGKRHFAQLESELQTLVAEVCERQVELPPGVLLTVQRVRLAPDLSIARVWVSVLPYKESDKAFARLHAHRGEIQYLVGQKVTRFRVPKLEFVLDESVERTDQLEHLLDSLPKSG